MPVSAIFWGTGFENTVSLPNALLDITTDRTPRAGSEWVQAPSGVEDAWITGFDYTLTCRAAFLPDGGSSPTPVSGAVSWQAFLDWARQKNPFRFVPDVTAPLFYVDGCYLVDPTSGFGTLGADIKRQLVFTIRNPTVDFHHAMRGIMFSYAPGADLTQPIAATFSRATAATRRGLPGTLAAAVGASDASGVLRDRHYEGTLRTTLLEAAATQLVTDPENFGAWTRLGTLVRTSGQADPFGGTAAYLIESNAGAGDGLRETVTFTGDGTKAMLIFMKQGTSTKPSFWLLDNTASVTRILVDVTWAAGVPTMTISSGGGTLFPPINFGAGLWALPIAVTGIVAANANLFGIYADRSGGLGTVIIFGANAWNAVFPSSYQGPSLAARNADAFAWPFAFAPQAYFLYLKFVERGSILLNTSPRVLQIGSAGSAPNLIVLVAAGTLKYQIAHNGQTGASSAILAAGPTIGDTVELLALLNADGSVTILQSINGAAATQATGSGATMSAAWSNALLGINSISDGTSPGFNAFASVKIGPLTFGGVTRNTIAAAAAA